jgi:hypothetical protein
VTPSLPPSFINTTPLQYALALLARYRIDPLISSSPPHLFAGTNSGSFIVSAAGSRVERIASVISDGNPVMHVSRVCCVALQWRKTYTPAPKRSPEYHASQAPNSSTSSNGLSQPWTRSTRVAITDRADTLPPPVRVVSLLSEARMIPGCSANEKKLVG